MGMIQAESRKGQMPHEDKTGEKRIVLDFEPHLEEFIKCDGVVLEINNGCCQHKHCNHDEQIEELECSK